MSKPGSESVLGFAFGSGVPGAPTRVVLIRKDHPPWAAGKWNGVGGAVEPPEEPRDAMVREFREETGMATRPEDWRLVAILGRATEAVMYVYAAGLSGVRPVRDDGPEPCYWHSAADLPDTSLPNLRWLVPLCLDDRVADVVTVNYRGRSTDPPKEPTDG